MDVSVSTNSNSKEVGSITVTNTFDINRQDLSDFMVAAFEGGINYWCDKIEIVGDWPEGAHFGSECLSLGVSLRLHDFVEDEWHTLTTANMLRGIALAMQHFDYATWDQFFDMHDAGSADVAVQFGIFQDIIYG